MSFEELNVPKNHIYLFKPHLAFGRVFGIWQAHAAAFYDIIYTQFQKEGKWPILNLC